MPSPRKRIGFLPRYEVQLLIDKICERNKLSQSKVTGILVEEALNSRGLLSESMNKLSLDFLSNKNNDEDDLYLNRSNMKDQIQMINDFIEFKFFKKIMNSKK